MSLYVYTRTLLRMMNDQTFLNSIENIDFRRKTVSIKSKFWRYFVIQIKALYVQTNESPSLNSILKQLKVVFIERFSEISANQLKSFFLNQLNESYFDFKNMCFYVTFFFRNGNPFKKNLRKLRKVKYFERKARRHYQHYLQSLREDTSDVGTIDTIDTSDEDSNLSEDPHPTFTEPDSDYIPSESSSVIFEPNLDNENYEDNGRINSSSRGPPEDLSLEERFAWYEQEEAADHDSHDYEEDEFNVPKTVRAVVESHINEFETLPEVYEYDDTGEIVHVGTSASVSGTTSDYTPGMTFD